MRIVRGVWGCFIVPVMAVASAGCQQQMAEQPSYRPFRPSPFFNDGRSARPLPEGVVARGQLPSDKSRGRSTAQSAVTVTTLIGASDGAAVLTPWFHRSLA